MATDAFGATAGSYHNPLTPPTPLPSFSHADPFHLGIQTRWNTGCMLQAKCDSTHVKSSHVREERFKSYY